MKFDVITFGSGVVDVFIDTDVYEKGKFMCYPVGEKILIKNLKMDVGGGGTNTAVAFSRLGLKTGWIGRVGDDFYGKKILNLMKKEKVRFLGKIGENEISGCSIILDSKANDRTILTYKGTNDEINFNDIKLNIKTKWLYFSSLLGKSLQTQKRLASLLFSKGVKLALNPSSYLIKSKNISKLIKLSEVIILNKEEGQMLLEKYDNKENNLLNGISSLGPKIVVITNKDKKISCFDSYNNKKYYLMPHKIKVVERTGAGDAFASGFVAGLIVGKPIMECLKLGLKESESVIKYFGAKNKLLRMNIK